MTGDDISNKILHHLTAHAVGHKTEGEGQDVGSGTIVTIEDAVGIEHMTGSL